MVLRIRPTWHNVRWNVRFTCHRPRSGLAWLRASVPANQWFSGATWSRLVLGAGGSLTRNHPMRTGGAAAGRLVQGSKPSQTSAARAGSVTQRKRSGSAWCCR